MKRELEKGGAETDDLTSKIEELNLHNDSSQRELKRIVQAKQVSQREVLCSRPQIYFHVFNDCLWCHKEELIFQTSAGCLAKAEFNLMPLSMVLLFNSDASNKLIFTSFHLEDLKAIFYLPFLWLFGLKYNAIRQYIYLPPPTQSPAIDIIDSKLFSHTCGDTMEAHFSTTELLPPPKSQTCFRVPAKATL